MPSGDLAIITQERFALAWPEEQARSRTLTEIWLASFKSQHTRTCYRRDLSRWLDWCIECDTKPDEARKAHTDLWIEKQRREGAAEASIARRVSAVASWYDYLIDNTGDTTSPLAVRNPAKTRARPRLDPDYSPTVALSRAEADRLIEAADKDGYTASALVRLLLLNGLRVGSAIDARIEDLGHDRGHRILDLTRKGGYRDRIAIPPAVGEPIDAMLAWRGSPPDGWLFVLRSGRQVYEVWVWRLIRELGARAGIPQAAVLSPHSLRATAITEYLNAGASLAQAQDFARHKDPRTTQRYNKNRHNLDNHGAYTLAGRYGGRPDDQR